MRRFEQKQIDRLLGSQYATSSLAWNGTVILLISEKNYRQNIYAKTLVSISGDEASCLPAYLEHVWSAGVC